MGQKKQNNELKDAKTLEVNWVMILQGFGITSDPFHIQVVV